jgi:hypothetical protein
MPSFFDMSDEHTHGSAVNFVEIFGANDCRLFVAELPAIVAPPPEPERVLDPALLGDPISAAQSRLRVTRQL